VCYSGQWISQFYQIKNNFEPTMPMSTNVMDENLQDFNKIIKKSLTTIYNYNSHEQEFVFCCKGKPFATLVSSNLPTPTSNLIDYDLVKDLNLKMTDLQCRKFYFGGNRFRILGKISTTVQCIEEGALSGVNFHIKGLVVSDLNRILDTHCVAGIKMKEFLLKSVNLADSVPDATHVPPMVPDDAHVPPMVPDDAHVSPMVPDDTHVSPMVPDDTHVSPEVPDTSHVPLNAPNARHVSSQVPSQSQGARQRHTACVQCHLPLGNTIDKDCVRCTVCHEKLLMMLARMPHKWFQPAFLEEMAAVRGIQCRAEYSDDELGFSDSDNSSHCSEESPFRRNWGKEPWKRNWEERLKRKRKK